MQFSLQPVYQSVTLSRAPKLTSRKPYTTSQPIYLKSCFTPSLSMQPVARVDNDANTTVFGHNQTNEKRKQMGKDLNPKPVKLEFKHHLDYLLICLKILRFPKQLNHAYQIFTPSLTRNRPTPTWKARQNITTINFKLSQTKQGQSTFIINKSIIN